MNFDENVKLCYMDTESFTVHVKHDIYKDNEKHVGTTFGFLNFELEGLLS